MEQELKILKGYRTAHVAFVDEKDKVVLNRLTQKRKVPTEVYKAGYDYIQDRRDSQLYEDLAKKHNYPPSAADTGKVRPLYNIRLPGIEIFCGKNFWRERGTGYYMLMDMLGLDSQYPFRTTGMIRNRRRTNIEVAQFLFEEFGNCKNIKEYQQRIFKAINKHIKNPHLLFDLRVLSNPKLKWNNFNEFSLEEAIEKEVSVNIEGFIAAKVLGIYATQF